MTDRATFEQIVETAVKAFPDNASAKLVDRGDLSMDQYHSILLMIFHQTFHGPSTFALAAAHCDGRHHEARDYLIHHADEEKSHWQWVISDLEKTGYTGPDPRQLFPRPACQAYIAFNVYVAQRFALGRLAIATVLESIGASYGKKYATGICKQLELTPKQALFFYGHGDTDVGHTADLLKVIDGCDLDARGWAWMCHAADMAGRYYKAMYDEALA